MEVQTNLVRFTTYGAANVFDQFVKPLSSFLAALGHSAQHLILVLFVPSSFVSEARFIIF